MNNKFDPINFLKLDDLTEKQKEVLRPAIYQDMAVFIVNKLVGELDTEELRHLEGWLKDNRDYELLMKEIEKIKPNFQLKKLSYLELYKLEFRLQKFSRLLAEENGKG